MLPVGDLRIYKLQRACADKVAAIVALTGKSAAEVQVEALMRVCLQNTSGNDFYMLLRRYVTLDYMLAVAKRECDWGQLTHDAGPSSGLAVAYWNLLDGLAEARQAVEHLLKRQGPTFDT